MISTFRRDTKVASQYCGLRQEAGESSREKPSTGLEVGVIRLAVIFCGFVLKVLRQHRTARDYEMISNTKVAPRHVCMCGSERCRYVDERLSNPVTSARREASRRLVSKNLRSHEPDNRILQTIPFQPRIFTGAAAKSWTWLPGAVSVFFEVSPSDFPTSY